VLDSACGALNQKEASMDMEFDGEKKSTREMFFEGSDEGVRSKTSNRMFYEAQVSVIQKQLGNLEKIRTDLGLSQRKICQLLMVDPSAWTRWQKENEAPPHIWRALQWYMTLQEKIPGLTPQYFIGKDPQILHEKALSKIAEEKAQRMTLEAEIHRLKDSFHSQELKLTQNLKFYKLISYISLISIFALGVLVLSGHTL